MQPDAAKVPEALRLERLWGGDFGDAYVERNRDTWKRREVFWRGLLAEVTVERVLEVGCNVGANLHWIADQLKPENVFGIDVNLKALAELRLTMPGISAVYSPGRELPFRDRWFD